MLAYVYGVVPISLCRSGGCGVSAGNGKGVRIEFDDENDMNVGSGAAATGESQHPAPPSHHLHSNSMHANYDVVVVGFFSFVSVLIFLLFFSNWF